MHPALSVVFFTAVSGSGYGLLFLLGLLLGLDPQALTRAEALSMLLVGSVLATAGLLASLAHLGQPQRSWRALSQWRSSWLSREGVAALACYGPIVAVAAALLVSVDPALLRVGGAALAILAVATVYCTVGIYTSLTPVPAWRDRLVLPGFLGFALLGGLLWLSVVRVLAGGDLPPGVPLSLALLAILLLLLKHRYWQAIDHRALPGTLASATGVPGALGMRPLEAPHTEANYLLREMGFVLARKHGDRLRRLTAQLLALTALLSLAALASPGAWAALPMLLALLAGQVAIGLERWLFFAQARHLVTLYYGATGDSSRVSADFTTP